MKQAVAVTTAPEKSRGVLTQPPRGRLYRRRRRPDIPGDGMHFRSLRGAHGEARTEMTWAFIKTTASVISHAAVFVFASSESMTRYTVGELAENAVS